MPVSNAAEGAWLVIANPVAGRGAVGRRLPEIEGRLRASLPIGEVLVTEHSHQAIVLTADAVRRGYRRVIAIGGDGTGHEVINGLLAQQEVPSAELRFALLPIGTGNDWARTFGLPDRLTDWLAMVQAGHTRYQDIGVVTYHTDQGPARRYFANVAGMAYDAFVVKYAEANKHLVRNRFVYLLLILRCLFQYRLQRARVRFDGQERVDRFYTINAGIARYSGGGMRLTPHAVYDDGRLALTLAGPVSKLGVLLNTWRFYNGSLGRHPLIDLHQARQIEVTSLDDQEIGLEVDGEFLGHTPVQFRLLEKALQVITPD